MRSTSKPYYFNEDVDEYHSSPQNKNTNDFTSFPNVKQEVVNKERIHRLQQRLSGVNVGLENIKQDQSEILLSKLQALEERINLYIQYSNTTLCSIQDQFDKLKHDFEVEKDLQDKHYKESFSDLKQITNRLNQITQFDRNSQKELEVHLLRTIDKKTELIKDEIQQEGLNRIDKESYRNVFEVEIPRIHEAIRQEVKERERLERRMQKYTSEEINKFSEFLHTEKLTRDEQTSSLLSIIEQVVAEVKSEVQQEHQNRQASEEMLVQLMEKTIEQMRDPQYKNIL